MKALRRMMAGLVCAALLFGRAAGEASFDFTDGMPDVPETAAPTENPAPTITLSPAFEMTVIRPAAQQHHGAILIYHTHTWEAYRQTDERYQETEKWRTKDERYNVVAVGEALTFFVAPAEDGGVGSGEAVEGLVRAVGERAFLEFEEAVGPRVEAGRLEVENGQGPVQCNEAHSILFPRGGCTNA